MPFWNRGDKNRNQAGTDASTTNAGSDMPPNQPTGEPDQPHASQDASSNSAGAGNGVFSSTATPSPSNPDAFILNTTYTEIREEPGGVRVTMRGEANIPTTREHLSEDLAAAQTGLGVGAANRAALQSASGNESRLLSAPTQPDSSADNSSDSATAVLPSASVAPTSSDEE